MKVTIGDVAKQAGVSKATVSRIINGNYNHNKKDTIQRVLKVIEDLNYQPNELAKSLKSRKTNVLGVLLSNLKNPFWVDVLEGIEDAARLHGFNLMICNSNEDAELEEKHIRSFQLKQVDGMIINPTVKNFPLYGKLVNSKLPLITINRSLPGLPIPNIVMDNVRGTKLAIDHFVKLRKQKIAMFVYSPSQISPRLERITGYKQGHLENRMDVDSNLIQIVEEKQGEAFKKACQLLSTPQRPDAILSTNNLMTLEILQAIKSSNLGVPEDISLIGYDETLWSPHLDPPLTTIYQPAYKMGEIAASKVIQLTRNPDSTQRDVTTLDPRLIIRESCGGNQHVELSNE
ncbi:LacI family DNA-binding transcriptional regulator [Halobacillus sp. MO56]